MQPLQTRLSLVSLVPIPEPVFPAEPVTEIREPAIIRQALADPDRARVVGVRLAVSILRKSFRIQYPVRTIQKLCSFEDHLYDMLVAMIFRGGLGVE